MTERPTTDACLRFLDQKETRELSTYLSDYGRWKGDAREEIVRRVEMHDALILALARVSQTRAGAFGGRVVLEVENEVVEEIASLLVAEVQG